MNGKNDALENFTWCALVALKLARKDNKIHSSFSEHVFIINWLTVAKKEGYSQSWLLRISTGY